MELDATSIIKVFIATAATAAGTVRMTMPHWLQVMSA
jgi:hypothetical protein